MDTLDANVSNAVQTEIKLYMTQQLHRKGILSDEMCANAKELILKEAKKNKPIAPSQNRRAKAMRT